MSEHILALHRSRVSPETAPFAPDFLRKYISYAKRIIPVLSSEAVIELRDFYLKMRAKGGAEAAVAITPRQLEALVRISEARARAFLRDVVTVEDAKSAIRIMTVSLSATHSRGSSKPLQKWNGRAERWRRRFSLQFLLTRRRWRSGKPDASPDS